MRGENAREVQHGYSQASQVTGEHNTFSFHVRDLARPRDAYICTYGRVTVSVLLPGEGYTPFDAAIGIVLDRQIS